jgi:hypothetical protein
MIAHAERERTLSRDAKPTRRPGIGAVTDARQRTGGDLLHRPRQWLEAIIMTLLLSGWQPASRSAVHAIADRLPAFNLAAAE